MRSHSPARAALCVAAAIAPLAAAPAASAQTVTYDWIGGGASQTHRLTRNMTGSHYLAPPKAFPGIEPPGVEGAYLYATFDFVNPYAAPAGFVVSNVGMVSSGPAHGLHLAAYLSAYDPTNLPANYLGDSGYSCHADACGPLAEFSVLAPANATITVAALRLYGGVLEGGTIHFDAAFLAPTATVPEPATWALVAGGLLGVAALSRRRWSA